MIFNRTSYVFGALVFLFGAATFGILVSPVASEIAATNTKNAGTSSEGAVDVAKKRSGNEIPSEEGDKPEEADAGRSQQYVQSLKMALGGCFGGSPEISPDTRVSVGFGLDGEGRLTGIPEYKGKSAVTADMRRLFLRGASALDECEPFPPERKTSRFEVVLSNTGILSLNRMSEAPDIRDPALRKAATAVNKPATSQTEQELSLTRAQRSEIQQRLLVLGFDPKGVDGVFGQNSRNSISAWQDDKGFPVTGFLSAVQLLALNAQSEADYAEYVARNPPKKKKRRRIEVCQRIGILGIKRCHYEYRWY
ncbi:peptidoglycan-binding domain-containing protein [Marimonas arenosa]|uniref:peptidoglycan-binding domain-containing protein n=1 Tax=Marimonas arenosa TaxID=1795305 RepID=UPI0027D249B8|nr:peptidoglycan-binding protein [Marimonas arenosa]